MAKEKSKNSCFQSKFGGGWISASQYLAEEMCNRFATSQRAKLPEKFWQDPYWCKKLKLQLKHANELLKKYSIEHILWALAHPDSKKVYSLGLHSVLVPLIEQRIKQERVIAQARPKQIEDKVEQINTEEKPRVPFGNRNNILNKLRELDDYGEEESVSSDR